MRIFLSDNNKDSKYSATSSEFNVIFYNFISTKDFKSLYFILLGVWI